MLKVLVAVDGSPASEQALALASQLISGKEADVTVMHVIPRHLILGKGGPVVAESYDFEEEYDASQALIAASAAHLRAQGIGPQVTTLLRVGDPSDLIVTEAEDRKVDMIVLGSRGLNAARRFLQGSVSTRVTTHAHCAVLVVHPIEAPEEAPEEIPEQQSISATATVDEQREKVGV